MPAKLATAAWANPPATSPGRRQNVEPISAHATRHRAAFRSGTAVVTSPRWQPLSECRSHCPRGLVGRNRFNHLARPDPEKGGHRWPTRILKRPGGIVPMRCPGGVDGSLGGLSEQHLEFGESLLDWIEIGTCRVCQEEEVGGDSSDGPPDGLGVGTRSCTRQTRRSSPSIGPSRAQAAREVSACHRPCGPLAIRRQSRGAHPWTRVMFVSWLTSRR